LRLGRLEGVMVAGDIAEIEGIIINSGFVEDVSWKVI